ncbi:tagaturonate epimerase family protein [Rariglobus hedericola]|uniref:Uncharacterized protein n=1 Tax=Rariglobus hedericola TaxID=2597822 RepID=A0A556QJH5_9BACT|nr:tagaturonate epimerase family protein [Rariglobus hedericola]TSJ76790.1 hypothetical protein FPL22_11750 [Rariglobus hedericola]
MCSAINAHLLRHNLRIADNPCISPDFCLDWPALKAKVLTANTLTRHEKSRFDTVHGEWTLLEDAGTGDCAWHLAALPGISATAVLAEGIASTAQEVFFPATFANLLTLKNLVLEADPESCIFPTASGALGRRSIGVGARFTTLHWPAVEWVMGALGIGLTANQNSIPRELVYDVDAMLDGRLDTVPFPFIGTNVPEGHQGQSVEGMSHGCILSKLKTGFHHRRIAWSFNADHQPIGGKFDIREPELVRGCLLASYITFDLSPELAAGSRARLEDLDASLVQTVRNRVGGLGLQLDEATFRNLVETVWPALAKMKRRDALYTAARAAAFTTSAGRAYLRELSIDELPGLTTPETTAVMLALCEALDLKIHFIAPAFGFQKNSPYADNAALRVLIERQWNVCRAFGTSIGFHSGSGKSADNYRVMGEVTGVNLEIKTSGRYTYEMGRALHASSDAADQSLWRDWHAFTLELAVQSSFSEDETERRMARGFVVHALTEAGHDHDIFATAESTQAALLALTPSPEHMFWFEYNFLYVLAKNGRAEKSALGDHSPDGYRQRARFYAISNEARLRYAQNVAAYVLFLSEQTGLAPSDRCATARDRLNGYRQYDALIADIAPPEASARRSS